jgi:diacylglycerol kinase
MADNFVQLEKKSFGFATEGLVYAFKTQKNFKIQLFLGSLSVILGFSFGISRMEWLILLFTICLVLAAELINTTIEIVVDLAIDTIHPKAKLAKDISAGVVLLIAIFAFVIGFVLFLPHIINLLNAYFWAY